MAFIVRGYSVQLQITTHACHVCVCSARIVSPSQHHLRTSTTSMRRSKKKKKQKNDDRCVLGVNQNKNNNNNNLIIVVLVDLINNQSVSNADLVSPHVDRIPFGVRGYTFWSIQFPIGKIKCVYFENYYRFFKSRLCVACMRVQYFDIISHRTGCQRQATAIELFWHLPPIRRRTHK